LKTHGLNRCSLIASPHGAIQCNMALHYRSTKRNSNSRRHQPHLVARISNWDTWEVLAKSLNHLKVQLLGLAWICTGAVHDEEIVFTDNLHGALNLLHGGHT